MTFDELEGTELVAHDGQSLGIITRNRFDPRSISNQYGQHGSQYSHLSILNQFGQYGSEYSHLSPFNMFTSTPPSILRNGQFLGFLTANQFCNPRIDVEEFRDLLDSI
jgi:hypothetical protein